LSIAEQAQAMEVEMTIRNGNGDNLSGNLVELYMTGGMNLDHENPDHDNPGWSVD